MEAARTKPTTPDATLPDPYDPEMTVVEIDGYGYVGVLTIPTLELELPVMSEWDAARLKIAPCRYSGSTKTRDLVIAGHNYTTHHRESCSYEKILFSGYMCLLWRTGLGGAAGLPLLRERRRPLPFVFKRGFPPKSKAAQMACKEVETWRRFRQEYQRKIQPNVRTWPGNGLENWLYCLPQRSGWTMAALSGAAIATAATRRRFPHDG